MQVASLELCKTLHELSGWVNTAEIWMDLRDSQPWHTYDSRQSMLSEAKYQDVFEAGLDWLPAYDLGYLLRKLQSYWPMAVYIGGGKQNEWSVSVNSKYHVTPQEADIPENAAARLAIELFRSGVLKRDA